MPRVPAAGPHTRCAWRKIPPWLCGAAGAEGLLQLGPGAAQGLADLVHFQLPFQVFDKIGAGILHQGILAALPPDAGHGAAQAAAAPGQQDQQVFQVDDELLHRAEGQLLFYDGPPAGTGAASNSSLAALASQFKSCCSAGSAWSIAPRNRSMAAPVQ